MKEIDLEEFNKRNRKRFGDKFEIVSDFKNNITKIKLKCNQHNIEFDVLPYSFLRSKLGCCPECVSAAKINKKKNKIPTITSTKEFIRRSREKFGDKFSYENTVFTRSTKPIKIYCKRCRKEFEISSARYHLKGNGSCPGCALRTISDGKKLKQEKIIEKCIKKHGDKYDLSKMNYKGCRKKIEIVCKKHGSFWMLPYNFYGHGQGCPICDQSHGEERISLFLLKNEIEYIQEKEFDDLKDKRKLRVDFYLPKIAAIIEYNGEYHYKDCFNSRKKFLTQKHHDWLKRKYARTKNIKYIVIPYWKYDSIEKILAKSIGNGY